MVLNNFFSLTNPEKRHLLLGFVFFFVSCGQENVNKNTKTDVTIIVENHNGNDSLYFILSPLTDNYKDTVFVKENGKYTSIIDSLSFENDILKLELKNKSNTFQISLIAPIKRNEKNIYQIDLSKLPSLFQNYDLGIIGFSGNEYLNNYQKFINQIKVHTESFKKIQGRDSVYFEKITANDKLKIYDSLFPLIKKLGDETGNSQIYYYHLYYIHSNGLFTFNRYNETRFYKEVLKICESQKKEQNPGFFESQLCMMNTNLITNDSTPAFKDGEFNFKSKTNGHESFIHPLAVKDKIVVIDFWASWCQPCIKELNELVEIHKEKYSKSDDVVFIAISIDNDVKKYLKFIEENPELDKWLAFFLDDGKFKKQFKISEIPRNFIYNKKVELVGKDLHNEKLIVVIDSLLKI